MTVWRTLRAKRRAFLGLSGNRPFIVAFVVALFRWLMWGVRCLLRVPGVVDIPQYGIRLYLAPRWKGCRKVIFVFREHFFEIEEPELEFTRRFLKQGDVFVDAGAYHGWYTLVASRAVGERGRVVAFEPNPDAFAVLRRNIELNGCRNIQAINAALSHSDGRALFYKSPIDGLASSLARVPGHTGQVEVEARRLDGVLDELNIPGVDFAKIDVEGSEFNALQGGIGVLRASLPTIVLEMNPAAARNVGASERSAWDLLTGLGYRIFRLSGTALVPLTEFPAVTGETFFNVVAIHGVPRGKETFSVGSPERWDRT